ncbi:putative Delta(12) fatty acid desaturase [Glarea lozoyensis 74030]|uniref:Putative Delta(12) fatty acid desaturase n=1 Tax=Glarea lozoyensis (strain ATCC 74030 / MF5533) TaxID=1104152 RepID=H0EWF6_GLAL7|nr:putative Delta(12) fatty acid desaturase [Glarea lozoyensis 74030]
MATTTMTQSKSTPGDGKHLDLHGNSFELPTFTMKEIHDAIPAWCFKPSILRSMALLVYAAVTYIPLLPNAYLRFAAWSAYGFAAGCVFTGIWILAHECGHGAFSKNKMLNYTMGLIMHSFLLVPFHSWRLSHSQHHKATGNMDRDTAFVPHKRQDWLETHFGSKAKENMVEFAELAEDSPIAALWHDVIHQLFGWPGYLLFNLTGQKYDGAKGAKISHFYFGEDSVFYKKNELPLIMLSDLGVAAMIGALYMAGQMFGSFNVLVLWGVPWLWVNNWIVAITFLQHTDGSMPHYDNSTWNFARGATATIDRDLGFLDTHLFHDIIGTHVCHHLISTIPFYNAGEASKHIKKVMGVHYKADLETPFWTAFFKNQRTCKFVEETEGQEGSGVYMFRNLFNRDGETQPQNLAKLDKTEKRDVSEGLKASTATATATAMSMASARHQDARRRLSQSTQLSGKLPILTEA